MELNGIMDVVRESMSTGDMVQGAVIALLVGFMMSRFGQLIYFTIIALLLDLIIVPLGMAIYQNEMNFGGAVEYFTEIISSHMDNLQYIAIRTVFFVVALIIVSILKSIFRRS